MKKVIIIVLCIVVLGAAGFMATVEIARRSMNAQQAADEAKLPPLKNPPDQMQQMARAERSLGMALENVRRRQNYAMIGGGVGAGVGLIIGLGATMSLDKKTRADKA